MVALRITWFGDEAEKIFRFGGFSSERAVFNGAEREKTEKGRSSRGSAT
jgi:hypothetical protein